MTPGAAGVGYSGMAPVAPSKPCSLRGSGGRKRPAAGRAPCTVNKPWCPAFSTLWRSHWSVAFALIVLGLCL